MIGSNGIGSAREEFQPGRVRGSERAWDGD